MPFLFFRVYPFLAWIAAGVFTILTLVFGTRAIEGTRTQLAAETYPTATGRIIHSDIKSRRVKNGTRYWLEIVYEFEVEGRKFRGTRRQYEDPEVSSHSACRKMQTAYPAGATVTVHYNPANPGEAVLVPGMGVPQYAAWLTSLATLMLAWLFWKTVVQLMRPEFDLTQIRETDTGFEVPLRGRSHLDLISLLAPPPLWIGSLALGKFSAQYPLLESTAVVVAASFGIAALISAMLSTSPVIVVDISASEIVLPESILSDPRPIPFSAVRKIAVHPRDVKGKNGQKAYTLQDCILMWAEDGAKIQEVKLTTVYSPLAAEQLVTWVRVAVGRDAQEPAPA